MFKAFLNWLVWSSEDPEKLAITIKGLIGGATTYIIWIAAASPWHLVIGADQISLIAVELGAAASALATLWGIFRKLFMLVAPLLKAAPEQPPMQL